MSDNGLVGRTNVAVWDERRNSSRVFPVTEEDVRLAREAAARFKVTQPALWQWVADGAPNLTEADHLARFGEPYRATRSRKTR